MADALFLIVVVGFFGLMVLLVKACDHIIGPDEPAESSSTSGPAESQPAEAQSVGAPVRGASAPEGGEAP